MWPRDSGRSWHTDMVKPEYGCTLPPAMSADSVATWNWMSSVRATGSGLSVLQRPHEAAALVDADGERAGAVQQPFDAEFRLADPGVELVVGGDGLGAFVAQADLQVVLQVLADAARVAHHGHAEPVEQRGRADARELQQLRRLDGAGRQQHFGARPRYVFVIPPCR